MRKLISLVYLCLFVSVAFCRRDYQTATRSGGQLTLKEAIFLRSVFVDDILTVNQFIQEGGDVNVVNDDGFTSLHISAMHGFHAMLRRLLEGGGNVHILTGQHGLSALNLAAIRGNVSIIEDLIAAGALVNQESPSGTSLQFALLGGHWGAVVALLLAGADDGSCVNNYSLIFQRSVEKGYKGLTEYLLSRKLVEANVRLEYGETVLVHAVRRNDSRLLRYLIEQGGNPNLASTQDGVTALHVAAMNNLVGIIQLLVDAGAQVNIADNHAITALRWCVVNNHVSAATVLLRANATIETGEEGEVTRSTLHWMASKNFAELAEVFIQESPQIEVNAQLSSDGTTALHIACIYNHVKMVKMLLAVGASRGIRADDGLTPHDYAIWRGHEEVAQLLQISPEEEPCEIELSSISLSSLDAVAKDVSSNGIRKTEAHAYINPDVSQYNLSDIMVVM